MIWLISHIVRRERRDGEDPWTIPAQPYHARRAGHSYGRVSGEDG